MPWFKVPTQRELSRSNNNDVTLSVLASNSGVTNGFHAPCASCCNPPPFPACTSPTQRDPSGLPARASTPLNISAGFSPAGTYVSAELVCQRETMRPPASQILPRLSLASVTAYGSASPSSLP